MGLLDYSINDKKQFNSGREYERERIIKLLENEKFILPEGIDEGSTLMPIQEAIALIKGEQDG
jgi:predicted nucleic acid-binding OB-fold protein